ncbi:MAG TPA: beta-galactosidase [Armatimonadota bacterium]|nr:beta-galactosidase [Armatimonadota bacterium]
MLKCIAIVACLTFASVAFAGAPLRLPDDRPFVGVYYFGHWWAPWTTDDDRIRKDCEGLRKMGVSVLCTDHEWSQAIDGDWKWLDREHRIAKETGVQILPWLSLKCWGDVANEDRMALMKEWYGVDLARTEVQDGSPGGLLLWDEETIKAGAAYASEYIDRYRDQALLHVMWDGEARPVVALSVELAWLGGFDALTTERFRTWLRARHGSLKAINEAWGTSFTRVYQIDPKDTTVFDYANHQAGVSKHPQAVEDHIEFRSQTISESLGRQAELLRQTHPDVLILAELPYQLASQHEHAEAYRIAYAANPSCTRSADILFLRCTGPLNQSEAEYLAEWMADTGQPVILTYRTYSDWCNERTLSETRKSAKLYGEQAAQWGNGFGFYSYNEMVDTHLAPSRPEDTGHNGPLTPEQSERGLDLMGRMIGTYLRNAAPRSRQDRVRRRGGNN